MMRQLILRVWFVTAAFIQGQTDGQIEDAATAHWRATTSHAPNAGEAQHTVLGADLGSV